MLKQLTKTELAIATNRTLFPNKVKSVSDGMGKTEKVIKKSTNVKLGKRVTKGKFKGMPIYTLTLEERATCAPSCVHYETCYGNNMPFATRYKADGALIIAIAHELQELNQRHKNGFLVRLHILGDFFSTEYVAHWDSWLSQFKNLNVYGYTEKKQGEPIGDALENMRIKYTIRFMVRISGDTARDNLTALSYDDNRAKKQIKTKQAFVCPVQTYMTDSCSTCGLCWTSKKNVVFITH
tara:strand:- start:11402 stop:12115 length:714 start_codon:yes stop_codon:yes gene_type:complete